MEKKSHIWASGSNIYGIKLPLEIGDEVESEFMGKGVVVGIDHSVEIFPVSVRFGKIQGYAYYCEDGRFIPFSEENQYRLFTEKRTA